MSAARTAGFTIHNLSATDLVLGNQHLIGGMWSDDGRVPTEILRGETVSLTAESDRVWTGTEGWIE